mmetsp:Transcript_1443/g.2766  ORF Transcript_1443/g.2766 Transcript_1443/m.2766 type:complete len:254 (+) Transcript_1443:135-896(+)
MQGLFLVEVDVAWLLETDLALVVVVVRVLDGRDAPDTGLATVPYRVVEVPDVPLLCVRMDGLVGAVVILLVIIRSQSVLSLDNAVPRDSVDLLVQVAERELGSRSISHRLFLRHRDVHLVPAALAMAGESNVLPERHGALWAAEDLLGPARELDALHVVGETLEDVLAPIEFVLPPVLLLEPLERLAHAFLALLFQHRHDHVELSLPCVFEAAPLASELHVERLVCLHRVHVSPVIQEDAQALRLVELDCEHH